MKKFIKFIVSLVLFLVIIPVVFYYSYLWGQRILEGGMLGGDISYHMSWIHTLDRFYPKVPIWFPFAGAGSSIVLGYWVFSYYLAIIGSHLTNLTADQWVRLLEFITVPIVCLEIYIYLWVRTKNQVMATLGALLYPLSSISWGWVTQAGFFTMQVSTVFYLPAFLFFDLYLETELLSPDKAARKRSFLLGYAIFMAFGFLAHGSFGPNLYLALPIYALLRSQLLPRKSEKRIFSFLRAVKVLVITIPLGVLAGAFLLLPQQRYFGLQPFVSTYGAADTPTLPWRGFLGFERLPLSIGSLYVPLFVSLLVSVFGLIGVVFALIKRNFLFALGAAVLFYVWWLSSAKYLATNFPFLQMFLLPTATRAASVTAIYLTIMAAYGFWSLADIPGMIVRFIGRSLRKTGKLGYLLGFGLGKAAFVISTILTIVIASWAFYNFRSWQTYPAETDKWGTIGAYQGYGTLGIAQEAPFCKVPGWEDEVAGERTCEDYMPQWKIAQGNPDFWSKEFAESVKVLDLGKTTRVSVSSLLGWVVFSFADHTESSLVSAPSGQSVVILDWLGIHDKTLFLEGGETAEEVAEMAKWFGTKYVFLNEVHKNVYPDDLWPVRVKNSGVVIREFKESSGIATLSTKPAVLVIGSIEKQAYILSFRVATKGGISFDQALLVKGAPNIDDYSLEELKQFSAIILQGYSYHSQSKAWELLKKYVGGGGSLYIDTGWQFVNKDWGKGPDKAGKFLPVSLSEPSPVKKTLWGNIGNSWNGAFLKTETGKGLDLESFGSLAWEDKGWGMALAEKDDLQSWAEPVLTVGNKVIVARGNFGQGRVVWSGMNLFSHAFDKENKEEYRLIGNIFKYLLPPKDIKEGEVLIDWDYPDRIELTLGQVPKEPAFLYWAETYTPDWRAYLDKGGKRERLEIYRAGPGFKAIRLTDLVNGEKLVLEHSLKGVLLASFGVTFLTFFVLLFLIIDALVFDRALEKKFKNRLFGVRKIFKRKITTAVRWDEEDE